MTKGYGDRAGKNGFTMRARTSTYGDNPKAPSQAAHNPVQTGDYGSGRSKRPDQASMLYVDGDHRTNGPGTRATGHVNRPAPKSHDGHLARSAKGCSAPGWRHCIGAAKE